MDLQYFFFGADEESNDGSTTYPVHIDVNIQGGYATNDGLTSGSPTLSLGQENLRLRSLKTKAMIQWVVKECANVDKFRFWKMMLKLNREFKRWTYTNTKDWCQDMTSIQCDNQLVLSIAKHQHLHTPGLKNFIEGKWPSPLRRWLLQTLVLQSYYLQHILRVHLTSSVHPWSEEGPRALCRS